MRRAVHELLGLAVAVCAALSQPSAVPCFPIAPGVRMPAVQLGTGASSYLHDCDEPLPNPPFSNVTCFKRMAYESTKRWLALGGSAIEMAQVDRNMIPVGRALEDLGIDRGRVFLETKCWGSMGFSATIECAADSLQMLGVDQLDLLLLHTPFAPAAECWGSPVWDQNCSLKQPLYDPGPRQRQESWRALETLLRAGRVRAIGLSDFTQQQLRDEILPVATVTPAVLETHWAPGTHDDALLAFATGHNITLQAWGALGAGTWGPSILHHPAIVAAAKAHNVSSAQVALRWSVQQGVAVIAGTGNPEHMRSDLALWGFNLTHAQMAAISAI